MQGIPDKAEFIKKEMIKNFMSLTYDEKFVLHFHQFIEKLKCLQVIGKPYLDYYKKLKTELEKPEEHQEYLLDDKRIKNVRDEQYIILEVNKNIKEIETQVKQLREHHDKNFEALSKLINFALNNPSEKKIKALIKGINEVCHIRQEDLQIFFDWQQEQQPEASNRTIEKQNNEKGIDPINNILERIGTLSDVTKSSDEEGVKTLKELCEEVKLPFNEEKSILEKSCNEVKAYYTSTWSNKEAIEIHKWAIDIKNRLSDEQVYEAIAAMDRANELVTGGHRLRDPQILAILSFLNTADGEGKLCQIKTGEGKTTIVSLLAAIKVLEGQKIDIITSNPVLAIEGENDKKNFYNLLNISVDNNNADENYNYGPRNCYKADIVYGSIGSFQFDYLRDSFEGLGTRGGREFCSVILDEVDSMLIDNGGHIAKLSGPLPGMDHLKHIYIKIWIELAKAEQKVITEYTANLEKKKEELSESYTNDTEDAVQETAQLEFEKFQCAAIAELPIRIKKLVKGSISIENFTIIPSHLKSYARDKLDKWIDNAMYVKYSCHENHQYVLKLKDGENVIVPVDHANTGITMKNTVWSHAIHQFLQLKHNLQLTSESLTTSFISNLGYIEHYNNKVYGLTGTLGSEAEQGLLSKIYKVSYARIPTYKLKNFEEYEGKVVKDDSWPDHMVIENLEKCKEGRSVLIICKTIADVRMVESNFKILPKIDNIKILLQNVDVDIPATNIGSSKKENDLIKIRIFEDEDSAGVTKEMVGPGEIIIATNIAGRGTDFKITKELKTNGGLHVCVGFLPCNERVEEQAFGRTSRQGQPGTAQLILRESEVNKNSYDAANQSYNFELIKSSRNQEEQQRIEEIKSKTLFEIRFNDRLFSKFQILYTEQKNTHGTKLGYSSVLADLKGYWGFWLEQQNFTVENLLPDQRIKELETLVNEKFNSFLQDSTASKIIEGTISHNPYYCIKQAELYIQNDQIEKAKQALEHALELSENPEILYVAYIKLFEISIESGHQLLERFQEAIGNLFFIPITSNRQYKQAAIDHLSSAQTALEKEIELFSAYFQEGSQSYIKLILLSDTDNMFVKHLHSRLILLNKYRHNMEVLYRQLGGDTSVEEEKQDDDSVTQIVGGVSIATRIPSYISTLDQEEEQNRKLKKAFTDPTLRELADLDVMYALKEVSPVPEKIISASQVQIASGMATLAAGIAFPPALPVCGPIAGALISEGVSDIVIELISQGSEFDGTEYAKSKAISYGISIATMGIGAIATSMKILKAASTACKSLSKALKASKHMKTVCTKVADSLTKLGQWFDKLHLEQFNNLSKAQQLEHLNKLQKAGKLEELKHLGGLTKLQELQHLKELGKLENLTKLQHLSLSVKSIGAETLQGTISDVVMEKVVTATLSSILGQIEPLIKEKIEKDIKAYSGIREALLHSSEDMINKSVQLVLQDKLNEIIAYISQEIAFGVIRHSKNWKLKIASLMLDTIVSGIDIKTYTEAFCQKLLEELNRHTNDEEERTDINGIINNISEQVTSKVYTKIMHLLGKHANTLVVGPIMQKGFEKLLSIGGKPKVELGDELEMHKQRTDNDLSQLQKKSEALKLLGLKENATPKEIEKAYKLAALKHHPDKKGGDRDMMDALNDARELLNPKKKTPKPTHAESDNNAATNNNSSIKKIIEQTEDLSTINKQKLDIPPKLNLEENLVPKKENYAHRQDIRRHTELPASQYLKDNSCVISALHKITGIDELELTQKFNATNSKFGYLPSRQDIINILKESGHETKIVENHENFDHIIKQMPLNIQTILTIKRDDDIGHIVVVTKYEDGSILIKDGGRKNGNNEFSTMDEVPLYCKDLFAYLEYQSATKIGLIIPSKISKSKTQERIEVGIVTSENESEKVKIFQKDNYFGACKQGQFMSDLSVSVNSEREHIKLKGHENKIIPYFEDRGQIEIAERGHKYPKIAHYVPYIPGCETYDGLVKTKVEVSLNNFKDCPDRVLTDHFNGCSLIIAINKSKDKMMIYHDDRPRENTSDKMKRMYEEGAEYIIRVDPVYKVDPVLVEDLHDSKYTRLFYPPIELAKNNLDKAGACMQLINSQDGWKLSIQDTEFHMESTGGHRYKPLDDVPARDYNLAYYLDMKTSNTSVDFGTDILGECCNELQ